MALKNCKECGNKVSTEAVSCPSCGAVLKKRRGCLWYIGYVILILVSLWLIGDFMDYMNGETKKSTSGSSSSTPSQSNPGSEKEGDKEGEIVNIGYTSAVVVKPLVFTNAVRSAQETYEMQHN